MKMIRFVAGRHLVWAGITFGLLAGWIDGAKAAGGQSHTPRMSWLDNGVIRLGVDLNLGGAITYLSPEGTNRELNLINSHDWGRQVQFSFYSGPVPFLPPGARGATNWLALGWNPIQSGDCFNHESRVVDSSNNGRRLYVKCVPMQWPLDNVPGECEGEVWFELDGAAVKARCSLTNHRADHTQYSGRDQELPAVYVNGPFYRLMTYVGDEPFTGGPLTRIVKPPGEPGFWSRWMATENWAAEVNDAGWGLGVWNPDVYTFDGGFAGRPGTGGPTDDPTGYIGPVRAEILDHNIAYEYRYELIVGTLSEIRARVYQQATRRRHLRFDFKNTRCGWYYREATDSGWSVRGELDIALEGRAPQVLSPIFCVAAADAPRLKLEAAFHTGTTNVTILWRTLGQQEFVREQAVTLDVKPDDRFHHYEVNLATSTAYRGRIVQIRLEPTTTGTEKARLRLRSVRLEK